MRIKCKKFECKEKIGDICVHSMKECKKSKKCKYIKEPCESCAIPYNYSKEIKEWFKNLTGNLQFPSP